MSLQEKEKNEFELEEFNLFGELNNVFIIGYILSSFIVLFFFVKYLFDGQILASIIMVIFILIVLSSIRTLIKLTGTKIIELLDEGLQIKYTKFGKVFFRKTIPWSKILNCSINKNEDPVSQIISCQLKLEKGGIILGKNIKKDTAENLKDAINKKLMTLKIEKNDY